MYAVVAERLSQTKEETIETGLGRAVDEVGAPDTFAGNAGERNDPAVCLVLHALAQQYAEVHRRRVVDLGQL